MTTSIVPVFKDNIETAGILASQEIHLLEEIPDTQKYFVRQAAGSLTEVAASFQMPNLNQWIQGEIEMVATRRYVFTGTTIAPTADTPATLATSPMLWSPLNSTVDGFCLNKWINEVKFNVANKAWTESDRQNPEMIDIFACQFDQRNVKSYGIYGEEGLKTSLEHSQNLVLGSDTYAVGSYLWCQSNASTLVNNNCIRNNYVNEDSIKNQAWQQNRKGYVRATVSYNGGKLTSYIVPGYAGLPVPVTAMSDIVPYYGAIVQTVDLEIHEYLISPSLSNPYSKNPNKKVYYSGGYPFNVQLSFNQDYVNSMFKWKGAVRTTVATVAAPVFASSTAFELRFWTFDSPKPLPSNPIKTIYYRQENQTPQVVTIPASVAGVPGVSSGTISTTNLSSLPPYIIGYIVARPNGSSVNTTYFTTTAGGTAGLLRGNAPYVEMATITDITLRLGTQSDVIANMNKEELVNHTLEVLGNKEFRDLLESNATYTGCGDLGQKVGALAAWVASGAGTTASGVLLDTYAQFVRDRQGFNFFILDVAKLNLRTVDGLPILPCVNYGSSSFKSLTLTINCASNRQMTDASVVITAEMNMVLMNKYLRQLPLLTGNMTDDKIEYMITDVSSELMQQMTSAYSGDGENQLVYVGGSFMGSVWKHLQSFLKHPVLKSAASLARIVRDGTKGTDHKAIHSLSNVLSFGADLAGLGKKGKYSRV